MSSATWVMSAHSFFQKILTTGDSNLLSHCLEIFSEQYQQNSLYQNYCRALKIAPTQVKNLSNIPFLPIEFFKTQEIQTGQFEPEIIFTSSGTTGLSTSRHFVKSLAQYESSFLKSFELMYGNPSDWVVLGLLPSYLERKGSSLIYMVEKLIALSQHQDSGFFLYDHEQLKKVLVRNEERGQKCLLIGVTFALLDFAEKTDLPLKHTVIMETGGMKGRGEELTRDEVSQILKKAFHVSSVHSEYGMTELLSQAYSTENGLFKCPPWMKVLVRDTSDPLNVTETGSGALNIIDLANTDSIAFIATQDLGVVYPDGSFEVRGRIDHSDIRGCNLLIA